MTDFSMKQELGRTCLPYHGKAWQSTSLRLACTVWTVFCLHHWRVRASSQCTPKTIDQGKRPSLSIMPNHHFSWQSHHASLFSAVWTWICYWTGKLKVYPFKLNILLPNRMLLEHNHFYIRSLPIWSLHHEWDFLLHQLENHALERELKGVKAINLST